MDNTPPFIASRRNDAKNEEKRLEFKHRRPFWAAIWRFCVETMLFVGALCGR
jgi:hypothetical protein